MHVLSQYLSFVSLSVRCREEMLDDYYFSFSPKPFGKLTCIPYVHSSHCRPLMTLSNTLQIAQIIMMLMTVVPPLWAGSHMFKPSMCVCVRVCVCSHSGCFIKSYSYETNANIQDIGCTIHMVHMHAFFDVMQTHNWTVCLHEQPDMLVFVLSFPLWLHHFLSTLNSS